MVTNMEDLPYDLCAESNCWHFVDDNLAYDDYDGGDIIAAYEHLDDGEKEHDHDPRPAGRPEALRLWRIAFPELFETYPDGKIGPNSKHFRIKSSKEVYG